jgi:sulfate permease, SulP family
LMTAIATGVTLGAFLFMHRMAEAVEVEGGGRAVIRDEADATGAARAAYDPSNGEVMVYRISGAFFFGATAAVSSVLDRIGQRPKIFVLDFSDVPLIDSTAAKTLDAFAHKLHGGGTAVLFAGARVNVRRTLLAAGLRPPLVGYAGSVEDAVVLGRAGAPSAGPAV